MPKHPAFFFLFFCCFLLLQKPTWEKRKILLIIFSWNGGMFSASLNVHIPHILSNNKKNNNSKSQFRSYKMWLKIIVLFVFGNWIHLWNVTRNDGGSLSPVMNLASTYSTTTFHHNQFQYSNFVFISFQSSKFQVYLIKASLSNIVICWV